MKKTQRFPLSDLALAAYVGLVALLLIVPVPAALIDVLLAFNIACAVLLLLAGLYVPNAVSLLTFPSILLLTTLLRLSLNVASTRLILTEGYAGEVIHSFGTFLIQGEIVVGLLLFAIISLVSLLVITRGAGRVSEVAARFTLDALPGRQMAIDADVRAGMITAEQAKSKREDLRRESMLYGSMDGAMKFVQGDALAGIAIIFINICGGIYLGLQRGMELTDAVHTYTVLTVGDGLVSQIPALLISICAGIVVTRVSSNTQNTTLGAEVSQQFFTSPSLLFLTAGILALIGVLPGVPFSPFALLAGLLVALAISQTKKQTAMRTDDEARSTSSSLLLGSRVTALPEPDSESSEEKSSFLLVFDTTHLLRMFREQQHDYRVFWDMIREQIQNERGLELPALIFRSSDSLPSFTTQLVGHGTPLKEYRTPGAFLFVESNPANAELLGCTVLKEVGHPLTGQAAFWTADTLATRRALEMAGIRAFDALQYTLLLVCEFFLASPEECYGAAEVHTALSQLEKKYPGYVSVSLQGNFLSTVKLTEVLQALIRQEVSISDFRSVVEAVARYCLKEGISSNDDASVEPETVVHYIRSQRRRRFHERYRGKSGALRVCLVDPDLGASTDEIMTPLAQQRRFGVGLCAILATDELPQEAAHAFQSDIIQLESLDPSERVTPLHEV